MRQVAEVDDAVGVRGAAGTARHDDVGVGQIQMRRLPRQALGERRYPRPRARARPRLDLGALRRVGDVRNQLRHNVGAVSQIPLQGPVEPGMAEVGQRTTDPARHFAEARDRRGGQIAGVEQRAAGQITQQPDVGASSSTKPVIAVHFSPARLGSGTATRSDGSASAIRSAAASWASNSVALKAGLAILSTPTIVAVGVADDEVAVLVAAQRFRAGRAFRSAARQDVLGLRLGHLRAGQLRLLEEIEADGAARTCSPVDELHDDVAERVVVVAGGGVPGVGQLDELGAGHLVQEVLARLRR